TAYPLHRNVALDDALFALRATEVDGSTKKSDAHNPQGSVLPTAVGATGMFSWKSGGLATSQMWISLTWSATTLYRPDGTTVAVPAPPAAPSAPTLSQVAGGTRGATTLFARIAYARSLNGWVTLYPVSAESSLAVGANSLLKITSPGAVAGYDGYV